MPLDVANGDVVGAELVDALLAQEEHERHLVAVPGGVAEVELRLEGARDGGGVDAVGQVRGVAAHRRREGGLAYLHGLLAKGALEVREEGRVCLEVVQNLFILRYVTSGRGLRLGGLKFMRFHHPDWAVGTLSSG